MQRIARWPAALCATAGLVLALLIFAGGRLIGQEQALEREQSRERLDNAASLVIRECERALAQALSDPAAGVTVHWNGKGIIRTSGARPLLWLAMLPPAGSDNSVALFAPGEQIEFVRSDPARAILEYRALLTHPSTTIRAGALLRIARCQRNLGRTADALITYEQLAMLPGSPSAGGAPAELVGRLERAALLEGQSAAAHERAMLQGILERGKHPMDRATFEFYSQGLLIDREKIAWTQAADELIRHVNFESGMRGSRIHQGFVADWTRDGTSTILRFAPIAEVERRMANALANSPAVEWRLLLPDAASVDGTGSLIRRPVDTGLPWGLAIRMRSGGSGATARLPFLLSGLALLGIVILGLLYLAYRAVRRELQVAAMQSEFVAAVSHEFRTPITAMTHLTDLLVSGDTPEARRPLYYQALAKETGRLREMVENLLDFGRIEAGRYKYKPESVDLDPWAHAVFEDFRSQPAAAGREYAYEGVAARVSIDREAMRRALWNLLDNANKYGTPGTRVDVRAGADGEWAMIRVADQGPGIEPGDRSRIFEKFVRGSRQDVKGTGIGLAMVRGIVEAHGGRVNLETEPGRGSCFTIRLPLEKEDRNA